VIGAHTGGFNTNTVGIAMLGNFAAAPVPNATVSGVAHVIAWKLAKYYLHPLRQRRWSPRRRHVAIPGRCGRAQSRQSWNTAMSAIRAAPAVSAI